MPNDTSMHLPNKTTLQGGKYRITRFISSGGFGCTYEASHTGLDKRVAIKEFFVKDFCNRDEHTAHVTVGTVSKKGLVDKLRNKFRDEAKALAKLQHPGIVRVSDVFDENGTSYFVMDYIDGRSLGDIVSSDGLMSEQQAVRYIGQVAEALAYVHSHNRLHLDIKPGNIMIGSDDRAVLIDFGASKQYDEADGENTSTLIGKTPGYAPLEQMGNDVVKFMAATDIYALGATLYKCLTGKTPISANLLASGEEMEPLPSNVSQATRQAVEAAMRVNKKQRPQTVSAFLDILHGDGQTDNDDTVLPTEDKPEPESKDCVEPEPRNGNIKPIIIATLFVVAFASFMSLIAYNNESTHSRSSPASTYINGHGAVDLGLSVKWATCNVGASSPGDYGNYYAWGETSTKRDYTEENSKTYEEDYGDIGGDPSLDAARANWGGTWRLPTEAEFEELLSECIWTWTTQGGHNGYLVTGKNENSIFLPATSWRDESSLNDADGSDYFWSSTPISDSRHAYCLSFGSGLHGGTYWIGRYYGQSVRPVSE